jgi:hypothetical protein
MATKNKVAGLHLWNVTVRYFNVDSRAFYTLGLWIITSGESLPIALKKAQTYLKRNRDEYRQAQIRKVEYQGTIDA